VGEGEPVDAGGLEAERPEEVGIGEEPDLVVVGVGAARGAVFCPAICLRISALKTPVMPLKVNLEEKAIAG